MAAEEEEHPQQDDEEAAAEAPEEEAEEGGAEPSSSQGKIYVGNCLIRGRLHLRQSSQKPAGVRRTPPWWTPYT